MGGSKRNFDIDLSWKATKPDWDFSTPESLKIDINAKGESPRWGNWMLSRDASFKVENEVIQADVSGKAHFKGGLLATSTPIVTEVHMKYLIPQRDLQGKFSKMINGKEYSINFPDGFGVMPQIKMSVRCTIESSNNSQATLATHWISDDTKHRIQASTILEIE